MTYEELHGLLKVDKTIIDLPITSEDVDDILDFSSHYARPLERTKWWREQKVKSPTTGKVTVPLRISEFELHWRLTNDIGPVRQYRSVILHIHTARGGYMPLTLEHGLPDSIPAKYPMLNDVILHSDFVCLGLRKLVEDPTKSDRPLGALHIRPYSELEYFHVSEAKAIFEAHAANVRTMMGW